MKKLILTLTLLSGTALMADVKAGEKVYKENCAICHTVNGGSALGPDFNMVSYRRHASEIEHYAKDPYSMFKAFGYSANAMPTLPLEDQQFKDVAEYISSLQPFKEWMKKEKVVKKEKLVKKEELAPKEKILVKSEENNETKRDG